MNLPPIPAWPAEVLPDEPVHGFFQRLAAVNGQLSCRTFAASLGLNGRNYDFEQMLDFCSALPVVDCEALAGGTPRRSPESVRLRSEVFSSTHFAFSSVRVCVACLAESRYHRNWFDFSFLDRCPIHDQVLVDGDGSEKLTRWFPQIGFLPYSGKDLAKAAQRVDPPNSLARYILGRIGSLPLWDLPHLREYSCGELIQFCDIVGRMREFGWSPKLAAGVRWDAARRSRAEKGFSVAQKGFNEVVDELGVFTAGSPVKPNPGQISFASGEFYGWLNLASRELARLPIGITLRALMNEHASRSGVFCKKGYESRFSYAGAETLTSLSRKLQITPAKLREIGLKDGLFEPHDDKSLHHSLTEGVCKAVCARIKDLMIRGQAAKYLSSLGGFSLNDAEQEGRVRPFIRLGGPNKSHDHFSRAELARCVNRTAR